MACKCSYESTIEGLLYSHQFWCGEPVAGKHVPSPAQLARWVKQYGQAEFEVMCEKVCRDLALNMGSGNTDASGEHFSKELHAIMLNTWDRQRRLSTGQRHEGPQAPPLHPELHNLTLTLTLTVYCRCTSLVSQ